jgi:hypothetical protein
MSALTLPSPLFLPGDYRRAVVIAVPVRTRVGVVSHKGILGDLLGPDRLPTVIHSSKTAGDRVVETSMTEYATGGLAPVTYDGYPGLLPPDEVLARARSALGQAWKLTRNCEHFVGWAHDVPVKSPQLRTGLLKAGVVGAAGAGLFAAAVVAFRRRSA